MKQLVQDHAAFVTSLKMAAMYCSRTAICRQDNAPHPDDPDVINTMIRSNVICIAGDWFTSEPFDQQKRSFISGIGDILASSSCFVLELRNVS